MDTVSQSGQSAQIKVVAQLSMRPQGQHQQKRRNPELFFFSFQIAKNESGLVPVSYSLVD